MSQERRASDRCEFLWPLKLANDMQAYCDAYGKQTRKPMIILGNTRDGSFERDPKRLVEVVYRRKRARASKELLPVHRGRSTVGV